MIEDVANRDASPKAGDAGAIRHHERWGLLPDMPGGGKLDLPTLLRYWFVQFNPLYFISAFCVLYGVFLVARNVSALDPESPERAQLILFGVIQAYEALIIGGAAFLVHRAQAVRPAVLLTFLEALFLFDCTFRLESIAFIGQPGAGMVMAIWLLLVALKVRALAAIMRVQLGAWHHASIIGSAGAIAAAIVLLSNPETNKLIVLQVAAWTGALVMLVLDARRPRLESPLAQTGEEQLRADRCITAIFRLLAGFYFYHVWSYIVVAADPDTQGPAILPQAGAFFLFYAMVRERDKDTWRFGLLTLGASVTVAAAMSYAMFLVAAVFGYRVWKGARSGLAVGAVFAVYAGSWLYGWQSWTEGLPAVPGLWSWQTIGLGIALCLIGWFLRDPVVWAMLGAGVLYAGYRAVGQFVPKSELGLGIVLLAAGFIAFLIGIAINWWFRFSPQEPKPPPAPDQDSRT